MNNNRTPRNRRKDRYLGTMLTNGIDLQNKELISLQTHTRATRHKQNGNAKVWARMCGVHFGGGGGNR